MLQDPRDLNLWSCHSQATWIRCTFPTPSFLGLERDVRPKLITITITTTTTTAATIDFTLKIKYMFFSIVIIFIVNLIILMNLIIFNLFAQVLIFFNLKKKMYGFSSMVIIIFFFQFTNGNNK